MDKNIELQVIRTIHPVGQGAFYTETLHRPGSNDDKHIVYDCGSLSSIDHLEREIEDYLPKGSTIDVLFISHFHADHVNGIRLLAQRYKIKHVVLPQIDDYEWFYIVENYLTNGEPNVSLISDVRAFIEGTGVVQVAYVEENGEVMSGEPTLIDGMGDGSIDGFSPLAFGEGEFKLWHYIVVNPLLKRDLEELRQSLLEIVFQGEKITLEDLHNPNILIAVQKDLREAYTRVFKGGNEYSMCVLSELADRNRHDTYSWYKRPYFSWALFFDDYRSYEMDASLYCGDADFMHYSTLDCLKIRLNGKEKHVGLLQLPHHGSKENFNIDLLNWLNNLRVSFACYGHPNRYNHPSSSVMGTASTYSIAVGVNQYKSNVLTERVDVHNK